MNENFVNHLLITLKNKMTIVIINYFGRILIVSMPGHLWNEVILKHGKHGYYYHVIALM